MQDVDTRKNESFPDENMVLQYYFPKYFSKWPFSRPLDQLPHCPPTYNNLPVFLSPASPSLWSMLCTALRATFQIRKRSHLTTLVFGRSQSLPEHGDTVTVCRLLNPVLRLCAVEVGNNSATTLLRLDFSCSTYWLRNLEWDVASLLISKMGIILISTLLSYREI